MATTTPGEPGPPLVDERVALWAAAVVAPRRRSDPDAVAALRRDVAQDLPAIDRAARGWSQLGADLAPVEARVVGRSGWVRANLSALQGAFEPLRERLERRHAVASRVLGAQLGALFGLLSSKVLGQYVLPLGGPGGGQLLVVGPNVLDLADEHGPLAADIRRTVVLHEVTHRLQFEATPWLGDHLRDLMATYLSHAKVDVTALLDAAPRIPEAVNQVRETGDIQPLLHIVLSPEQAEIIEQAQGLMSLLEGHGNAAMYTAPETDLIADPDGVRDAMASRRKDDITSRILTTVAGMDMKRRQYQEGERFVHAVVERAGIDGLNLAFAAPGNLPRADEVGEPDAWLARVSVA